MHSCMRLFAVSGTILLLASQRNLIGDSPNSLIPTDRFVDDLRRKDIDDILSLYADNAIFVDSSGTKHVGREALTALYQQTFRTFDSEDMKFTHTLTLVTGPYSAETVEQDGLYSEDLRTRATDIVQHLCGGYHVIYHHTSGWKRTLTGDQPTSSWLITYQAWTSTPCPPTTNY
jgi:ketosteroid isomerase-like protein